MPKPVEARTFILPDGSAVKVTIEEIKRGAVLGTDQVTGGGVDYAAKTDSSMRIEVKPSSRKFSLKVDLVRSAVQKAVGESPSIMPPTKATGLITMELSKEYDYEVIFSALEAVFSTKVLRVLESSSGDSSKEEIQALRASLNASLEKNQLLQDELKSSKTRELEKGVLIGLFKGQTQSFESFDYVFDRLVRAGLVSRMGTFKKKYVVTPKGTQALSES